MLQNIVRGLVGVTALFGVFMAVRFWWEPVAPGAQLGIGALNELGYSTLRADFASFFFTGAAFALAAAIKNDRRLVLVPLAMFGLALTARLATGLSHGFTEVVPPIAVEAVFTAIMFAGWRVLAKG
jgi:hypothetical protein